MNCLSQPKLFVSLKYLQRCWECFITFQNYERWNNSFVLLSKLKFKLWESKIQAFYLPLQTKQEKRIKRIQLLGQFASKLSFMIFTIYTIWWILFFVFLCAENWSHTNTQLNTHTALLEAGSICGQGEAGLDGSPALFSLKPMMSFHLELT